MDSIQTQVILLTNKIDALHQVVDRVNNQVTALTATQARAASPYEPGAGRPPYSSTSRPKTGALEAACEHKDVLLDSSYLDLDRQNTETTFSPDVQIQRLTAQLTAAYNRIAALEEQLMAARVH